MDDISGTVIERRIQDVMAMGAKKNQTYKPRQGGTNRNLQNYLPEQIEFTKKQNEELFHIFGYVKDEQRNPESVTPFMDYEGKADAQNVAKTNYYKKLNEMAMEKRMRIQHGKLADSDKKVHVGPGVEGGVKLISQMKIMESLSVLEHIEFTH